MSEPPAGSGSYFGVGDRGEALIGRQRELAELRNQLAEARTGNGSALIIRGEAGIGKSALLQKASTWAAGEGFTVFSTAGTPTESRLPYSGLHQMLRPVRSKLGELPDPQRSALDAAFGVTESAAPDLFLVALATLELLVEAAAVAPVLMIVEDAHWLDEASAEVVMFVARRIDLEPVSALITVRDGATERFDGSGTRELRLGPLEKEAARALLSSRAEHLSEGVQDRLLADAMGNPLALIELPRSIDPSVPLEAAPGEYLPLSDRLEKAFAARLIGLPTDAQTILLTAAADAQISVAECLEASSLLAGRALDIEALAPAEARRLVEIRAAQLHFRHPLVRAAVYQSATTAERYGAHSALATVLAGDGTRSIWHRAAAAIGKDEELAAELELLAENARSRGAISSAVAALERAVELTDNADLIFARALRGAELAAELSQSDVVARLVRVVEAVQLAPLEAGRLEWVKVMADPGPPGEPGRMRALMTAASRVEHAGDRELGLRLLWAAAMSGFWADREPDLSAQILQQAERMDVPSGHPRRLAVIAYAAPIDRGAAVHQEVARLDVDSSQPDSMWLIAEAATTVGGFDIAEPFATAAVFGLRAQGRLGALTQALVLRAWCHIHVGRWDVATPDAQEAERLARETAQPIWRGGAQAALSILAGMRGEREAADEFAAEAERVGLQFGARAVLSVTQLARGLNALGDGRYEDAYVHLRPMFDPEDPSYHRMESCWAIGNLAEAAARSEHREDARDVLTRIEAVTRRTSSSWLQVSIGHARALLAADDQAQHLYLLGLRQDLTRWPFDRARLLLAYGAWLRRQRRVADARAPLREARDRFEALGVLSWGERARQELRAAGELSGARTRVARDRLSAQELQIARMAAAGLTNREIGQRLYLSHRTIGSHLYRVFPKLGISSRSELAIALGNQLVPPHRDIPPPVDS